MTEKRIDPLNDSADPLAGFRCEQPGCILERGHHDPHRYEPIEPLNDSRTNWRDAEYIEPQTISDARFQMCAQLHRALYGDVWARPESPSDVWADMLARIERAARALRR